MQINNGMFTLDANYAAVANNPNPVHCGTQWAVLLMFQPPVAVSGGYAFIGGLVLSIRTCARKSRAKSGQSEQACCKRASSPVRMKI